MKKIKKSTLIGILFAAIVCIGVCWGVSYFIDHINGNTKTQIEAQNEMQKYSEEAENTMNENSQWYQDELEKYKN
ncbi:MAG: hypothetical protein HDS14_03230 [Bacteroides sp.]|nr:hypothetical protein [Bacteroides sp.]